MYKKEMIEENFPNIGKEMDIQIHMTRKEPLHDLS